MSYTVETFLFRAHAILTYVTPHDETHSLPIASTNKCASRVHKVSTLHPSASVVHNNRFRLFADNAPNFPVGPRAGWRVAPGKLGTMYLLGCSRPGNLEIYSRGNSRV